MAKNRGNNKAPAIWQVDFEPKVEVAWAEVHRILDQFKDTGTVPEDVEIRPAANGNTKLVFYPPADNRIKATVIFFSAENVEAIQEEAGTETVHVVARDSGILQIGARTKYVSCYLALRRYVHWDIKPEFLAEFESQPAQAALQAAEKP